MLNGLKSADATTRRALGMQRSDPTEYTPVQMSHVDAIVGAIGQSLGVMLASLHGVHGSPFGGGNRPWVVINNAGGNLGSAPDANGSRL